MKYTEITAPQFLNIVRRSREAKLIDILEKLDLYPFKTGEQSDVINYYSMKHVSMIANQLESGGLISISGTKGIDLFD